MNRVTAEIEELIREKIGTVEGGRLVCAPAFSRVIKNAVGPILNTPRAVEAFWDQVKSEVAKIAMGKGHDVCRAAEDMFNEVGYPAADMVEKSGLNGYTFHLSKLEIPKV